MAGDTRIFKMTNVGIYLNDRERISYSKTNIPIQYFSFTDVRNIYWLVKPRITKELGEPVILIDVVDYDVQDLNAFVHQKIEGEVPVLKFQNIDWNQFIRQVVSYSPNKLKGPPFVVPEPDNESEGQKQNMFTFVKSSASYHTERPSSETFQSLIKQAEIDVSNERIVPFSVRKDFGELEIKDGYAQVVHREQEIGEELLIKVYNDVLRSEYDLIKAYFANRLGRKTVQIEVCVKLLGYKVVSVDATSPEIAKIDQAFLDVIKRRQILAMRSVEKVKAGKGLYTIEEVAEGLEEAAGKAFSYKLDDIIQVLTDNYRHRNSKQIIYLAEQHKSHEEVLRLTLKPNFGFVFFLTGEHHIHYVWELLNSHATYIWSFLKERVSKDKALDNVELFINEIGADGRNKYKTQIREGKDYIFTFLEHKLADDGKNILFEQWHKGLEAIVRT